MADFEFIKDSIPFSNVYLACRKAEDSQSIDERVSSCKEALIELFKVIYSSRNTEYSDSATLVEIINSPVITGFVADEQMLKALHFIRKLGNNQKHGES